MINYRSQIKEKLSYLYNFYNFTKGYKKTITRKKITNFKKDTSKELIDKKCKNFFISEKKVTESFYNIQETVPSVMGWVPYIKNKTSVVVFNFFSFNYAIRGQFFCQISVVYNNKVKDQKKFWIPDEICHEFKLINFFPKIDGDAVFVEMFHPKLSFNHGGHDGNFRFWGKYYNKDGIYVSTVHSTQHSKEVEFAKKINLSKNFIDENNNVKDQHVKSKTSNNQLSKTINNQNKYAQFPGFNVLNDINGDPCAIWHHGPSNKISKKNTEPKKSIQTFWCPPNDKINPTIILEDIEGNIILDKGLKIHIIKNSKIVKSSSKSITKFNQFKISDIFEKN